MRRTDEDILVKVELVQVDGVLGSSDQVNQLTKLSLVCGLNTET